MHRVLSIQNRKHSLSWIVVAGMQPCADLSLTFSPRLMPSKHPNLMASDLHIVNPRDASLPPPLSAVFTDSYAYKTVQNRMPVILTKIVDHLSRHKSEVYDGEEASNHLGTHGTAAQEAWNAHRKEAEEELKEIIGAIAKLRNELQTNKPITPLPLAASADALPLGGDDIPEWNDALDSPLARNLLNPTDKPKWFESAWLFVESYMYRRVMWCIQRTKHLHDLDPFKWQKADSIKDNTQNIHGILDYLDSTLEIVAELEGKFSDGVKENFENLLRLSLWGNKGDLSHSAGKEPTETKEHDPHEVQQKMSEVLVVDESATVWQYLVRINNRQPQSPIRIDIICDNYGLELITDLVLGEFLIVSGLASQIRYHVKRMPWFVSDTTIPDFNRTLDLINEHDGKFGDKWMKYIEEGKFLVLSDPFWSLPYEYDYMLEKAPDLYRALEKSTLIILKGDLNYRKLVGDLAWSPVTTMQTAVRRFFPSSLCVLRGLKAETVVGLRDGLSEEMAKLETDWMSSGNFAVIQFLEKSS
ncbi:damage-control phosphatase ARMT1-like [Paramacrobiotus metropolitanus]|uniref:damage-control phosphatase ARMT1-like n=1 Tax=Paramacrobiotus metropolitanus TaxID=2943436 RepID=UPI0024457554|nr:damage-control phosphatase ARMT1-like [Paramacrobiotus metropolitanus]